MRGIGRSQLTRLDFRVTPYTFGPRSNTDSTLPKRLTPPVMHLKSVNIPELDLVGQTGRRWASHSDYAWAQVGECICVCVRLTTGWNYIAVAAACLFESASKNTYCRRKLEVKLPIYGQNETHRQEEHIWKWKVFKQWRIRRTFGLSDVVVLICWNWNR